MKKVGAWSLILCKEDVTAQFTDVATMQGKKINLGHGSRNRLCYNGVMLLL